MTHLSTIRSVLLAGAALALPFTSAQAATNDVEADGDKDRNYLPPAIIVVGHADDYLSEDGSTATKTPTALIDVPQTVSTITEDQLDDQAITQLGEALRYVPGISLDTGEGHRDQIYIRGQASTADFYLDGLRDDAQYYRSLYNVARVEVLKGSNALIFGRGGGGGVINRVSKVADITKSFSQFNGSVDTFGAFALSADINQPFSQAVAGRINTTYEEFANHRDFYNGRFIGISPTITAQLGEATQLTAQYTYDDDERVTDRGLPSLNNAPLTGYDKTFFGSRDFNRATSKVHIARLRLDHQFSDSLSGNLSGQFADYDKFYANVVPTGTNGTTVNLGGYTSGTKRQNWIGQGNLVWDVDFGGVGNTLLTGFEFGRQDTDANRHEVDFGGGVEDVTVALTRVLAVPAVTQGVLQRNSTSSLDTFSAYIQDQVDFGIVQLVGGIRYDEFSLNSNDIVNSFVTSRKDKKWSPRVGVIVKPQDTLSIYASYATSFLPQSGDQFTVLSTTTADLEPEKFENLEAGIKWAIQPDLFATAAIFQLDRSNTRAEDPNNPGFTILTGESRVQGFEMSLVGKIMPNWQANLGYTYLDGEIRSDTTSAPAGRRLRQLPKHQFSLWNRFDVNDKLGFGAGVIYQDEQFASSSSTVVLPDYWRVDLAAYYTVNDRLSFQINIENLFDESYFPSAHGNNNIQSAEPFSARLGVKVSM